MKALTLWPIWAWAVLNLDKDVENRSWKPPVDGPRRFLLHAGATLSWAKHATMLGDMARRAGWRIHAMDGGLVFVKNGVEKVLKKDLLPTSALVGELEVVSCTGASSSAWAVPGDLHWGIRLTHRFARPIESSGALGFWEVEGLALHDAQQQLKGLKGGAP
jgi:hypothetical protein